MIGSYRSDLVEPIDEGVNEPICQKTNHSTRTCFRCIVLTENRSDPTFRLRIFCILQGVFLEGIGAQILSEAAVLFLY